MPVNSLPPELQQFAEQQIASGKYRDEQELIQDSVRLLRDREQQLDKLREDLCVGLEEIERGEVVPGEEVFEQLREKLSQLGSPGA